MIEYSYDLDVEYYIYDEGEYNQDWNKTEEWKCIYKTCSLKSFQNYEEDVD